MRAFKSFSILIAAILLLGPPPVEGQCRPVKRLFSGEKTANPAKRGSSSQIREGNRSFLRGPKRVEVDLTAQMLRAYEGNRLVMKTNISSGRGGCTPTGHYHAGYKDPDHHSSLFHNAPMPWSVQVSGNIFIHGFSVVPNFPASHGCIRVPITGRNPAKRFFDWVDVGTPISIAY